jgi:hypothetical protein
VLALKASPGQLTLEPVQFSARSQKSAEARHSTVLALKASLGHPALEPVQFSARSQKSAEARHSTVLALKASLGQPALEPVQFSARSQKAAEARHSTVLALKASSGHVALEPVQFSATSQKSDELRQSVPEDAYFSMQEPPSHLSCASQSPPDAVAFSQSVPSALGLDAWQRPLTHDAPLLHWSPAALHPSRGPSSTAGWVHDLLVPSQTSLVQTFPSSVQDVFVAATRSPHVALEPVQKSVTSQSPFFARHSVVSGANPPLQTPA